MHGIHFLRIVHFPILKLSLLPSEHDRWAHRMNDGQWNLHSQNFASLDFYESYLMEMKTAENEMTHSSINTNSGIAVGVLHGKTDRIIVIGGHIDSASPDIPGANDNGSGSAVVIELARILSKEQHQSTFVFCLFGGEEAGLCGSDYFVRHFPQLDSVVLMQNIDMANGSDILIPTVEIRDHCTPKWLVKAAFEEIR